MEHRFIGITLPIQRGSSGMFKSSTTMLEQAKSNLRNLILTRKGERLGQPEFGCDLWKLLFEQIDEETEARSRAAVVDAVDRWLPYLQLRDVTSSVNPQTNAISIRCSYVFRANPRVGDSIEFASDSSGRIRVSR